MMKVLYLPCLNFLAIIKRMSKIILHHIRKLVIFLCAYFTFRNHSVIFSYNGFYLRKTHYNIKIQGHNLSASRLVERKPLKHVYKGGEIITRICSINRLSVFFLGLYILKNVSRSIHCDFRLIFHDTNAQKAL